MAQDAEAQLVAEIKSGNRAALGMLLESQQSRLYQVCLRMLGNRETAAEACQEAMLKIIQSIGDFRGESRLSSWMVRIAMNQSLTRLRRDKVRRTLSIDAPRGGGDGDQADELRRQLADTREPTPDVRVEQEERQRMVLAALADLEPDHRRVLVLRDVDGMDYAQIAEVLELALGTVKSRLFRARVALRQRMDELEAGGASAAGELDGRDVEAASG
ncbi:MAG: sigma-70 family RNA polymerase sigma factor [Planctomycetota bacterium]